VFVGAVFDGHGGYNGLVASNTAREQTLIYFEKNKYECEKWSVDEWKTQMRGLFEQLHHTIREKFLNDTSADLSKPAGRRVMDEKGIVRTPTGDPVHGGTTGSLVAKVKNADGSVTLITANVGDSTCLISPKGGGGNLQFLTVDHGPESKDEYLRVKLLDPNLYPQKLLFVYDKTSVFRKYECPSVFLEDGNKDPTFVTNPWGNGLHPTNVRYEPAVYAVTPRVVTKDSTCIAMTRALGDFYAHQFGLCCDPSIGVKHFPAPSSSSSEPAEWTVYVASDGVWDCWKFEDFAAYCNKLLETKKIQDLGDIVLTESISKAITNFGAKNFDDASLVIFPLSTSSSSFASSSSESQKEDVRMTDKDEKAENPS